MASNNFSNTIVHIFFLCICCIVIMSSRMSDKEDKTTFDVTFRGMNRALLGRRYINRCNRIKWCEWSRTLWCLLQVFTTSFWGFTGILIITIVRCSCGIGIIMGCCAVDMMICCAVNATICWMPTFHCF